MNPTPEELAAAISDIENAKAIRDSDPHFTRDLHDLDSPWILLQAYKNLLEAQKPMSRDTVLAWLNARAGKLDASGKLAQQAASLVRKIGRNA